MLRSVNRFEGGDIHDAEYIRSCRKVRSSSSKPIFFQGATRHNARLWESQSSSTTGIDYDDYLDQNALSTLLKELTRRS